MTRSLLLPMLASPLPQSLQCSDLSWRSQNPKPKHYNKGISLLHCCQTMKELHQLHAQIIKTQPHFNLYDSIEINKIIYFSATSVSGSVSYARSIFDQLDQPTSFLWNAMIRGYAKSDSPEESILFFYRFLYDGFSLPDRFTFPFLLKACSKLFAIEEGKQFHSQAVKRGFEGDVFVQRALVPLYVKCDQIDDALRVFLRCLEPNIVCWNDLINGYARNGELEFARKVFDEMPNRNGVSWTVLIDGYVKKGQLEIAHQLFDEMPERTNHSWNSLIGGYLKSGQIDIARKLFGEMPEKDIVSWTAMISGYVQNCLFREALELFHAMQSANVEPNRITLVSILPAVAHLGSLTQGRWIHAYMNKKKVELDDILGSALIDMYSKCGSIAEALKVFEGLEKKELSAWNSIILGLATHGLGKDALAVFSRMVENSLVTPNDITFVGVLSACSHAGLVNDGKRVFNLLTDVYGIIPNVKHYGCMVDLLGRAGLLEEAKELIEKMPMEPNSVILKTLLGACRVHKNAELAEQIAKSALELGPQDSGFYVLLSNIFSSVGRWHDVGRVRRLMNDLKVQKVAGCSWVEVNGTLYEFLMGGEGFHGRREEILSKLEEIERMLRLERYEGIVSQDLVDIEERGKRFTAGHHSEKLAIAFGLIHASHDTPIRVMKNLRICDDCHSTAKLISKVYDKEIIARDQSRFHHFKNGSCSCMDYW